MKPNFALGLTEDGITLWQRGGDGWLRVGAVAPEAADMDAQMQGLAQIAQALAPDGVLTKLVVPDEQMLFCDLPVSARNREMQGHEIRAQLVGRTPYPVEELDIDWTVSDGVARAAVVARETLVEAEDFAREYGFNPVTTVAAPKDQGFTHEPFFGPTRSARDIVGDVSVLERDEDILQEVGIAQLPEPELVQETAPVEKAPSTPPETETAVKTEPERSDPPPAPTETEVATPERPQDKPEKGTVAQVAPEQEHSADDTPESVTKDSAREAPKTTTPAPAPKTPSPAAPETAPPPPGSGAQKAAVAGKAALLDKLKAAKFTRDPAKGTVTDRAKATLSNATAALTQGSKSEPRAQDEPDAPGSAAFRSRRATGPVAKVETVSDANASECTASQSPGLRAKLADAQSISKRKISGLAKALGAEKRKPDPAQAKTALSSRKAASDDFNAGATSRNRPSQSGYPLKMTRNPETAARKDPLETLKSRAASGGAATNSTSEAERMTIFGARNNDLASDTGQKRALLVLGGVGMVLLAAGVWAFYFMSRPAAPPEDLAQTELPADVIEPAPILPDQLVEGTAAEPSETPLIPVEDMPLPVEEDIEAALGLEDAAEQVPFDTSELGQTETVQRADPDAAVQAEEPPMSVDEHPTGRGVGLQSSGLIAPQDPVPLPEPPDAPAPFNADDLPPTRAELAQMAEAAAADPTEADLDTPAEALTVDREVEAVEITVSDGTPPMIPPDRPDSVVDTSAAVTEALESAALEDAADISAADIEASPDSMTAAPTEEDALPEGEAVDVSADLMPEEADLDISVTEGRPAATPPQRPEGLVPQVDEPEALAPESTDEAEADPITEQAAVDTPPPGGVVLSLLRPEARPETIGETAGTSPETGPEFDASDLAVAQSQRPGARPSQFATIVQRALRSAQQRSPAEAPVQTARAAVPSAPPIPASASVAREATQARAINLRQINLIGVMGTSSSRRALVRLSNGRIVTVGVGDSLDNGQVTAISESELRYTRRGRNVVLRLPS